MIGRSYSMANIGKCVLTRNRVKESSSSPERPAARGAGRQTVQWPFQSVAISETEITSPTTSAFARRATWEPKRRQDNDSDSIARDIIPDYVINYIRGETPETVARRKRNGGKLGERGVDIAHQHQPHQSRVADFEGFLADSRLESRTSNGSGDEERQFLSGSRGKSGGGWRRFTGGWRAGVALNTLLSSLIFMAGLACLLVAASKASLQAGHSTILSGSCQTVSGITWGLQAAVNIFSVVLIAGATYVFQVLSAPTSAEVAVAHQNKKWLDIGIPSFRNFAHIENARVFLAVTIFLLAATTQIM
jgi:hypothetical protein